MTETKTANDYEGVPVWILVIEVLEDPNADPMATALARRIIADALNPPIMVHHNKHTDREDWK